MNMKQKFVLVYFVIGCVWTIVNLPNLLGRVNNSAIKATLLAIFRIIAWPILSGKVLFDKVNQILAEKKAKEQSENGKAEIKNAGE